MINNYIFLALSNKLYLHKLDKSQTIELWYEVLGFAYFQENQIITLIQQDKISLTVLENDKLNIKFEFEFFFPDKFSVYSCSFSQDGKEFLLVCNQIMALLSTKSDEKMVQKVVHIAEDYTNLPIQAFLFENKANPNNLNNLALLYGKKFKIINAKSLRTLLLLKINYLTPFELSLDENIIFTVSIISLFVLCFNKFKIEIRKEINYDNKKFLKIINNDTFIQIKYEDKIIQRKNQIILLLKYRSLSIIQLKQLLVIVTNKNNINFYDFQEKKKVRFLKGDQIQITSTAISKNGNIFVTSSDNLVIRLWNIKQNESQEMMHAHQYSISALTISQGGQIVVSGSIWVQKMRFQFFFGIQQIKSQSLYCQGVKILLVAQNSPNFNNNQFLLVTIEQQLFGILNIHKQL